MIKNEVCVSLLGGLHALSCFKIGSILKQTRSAGFIKNSKGLANIRDPIGLLRLGVRKGDTVEVFVDGPDEKETFTKIKAYLEGKK